MVDKAEKIKRKESTQLGEKDEGKVHQGCDSHCHHSISRAAQAGKRTGWHS